MFTPTNPRATSCSQRCTDRAFKQRQREQAEPIPERTCVVCGASFTPQKAWAEDDPYKRGRFCSRACKVKMRALDGRMSGANRRAQLKTKYGITVEEYQTLLDAQGGACAICKRTEPIGRVATVGPMWLHVDHNHKTGRVRGLLCMECNTGLGKFQDDVTLLQAAIRYLQR